MLIFVEVSFSALVHVLFTSQDTMPCQPIDLVGAAVRVFVALCVSRDPQSLDVCCRYERPGPLLLL